MGGGPSLAEESTWKKLQQESQRRQGVRSQRTFHQPVLLQPYHLSFALVNQLPALTPTNRCKSKKTFLLKFCSCLPFSTPPTWPSLPTTLKYIYSNSSCTSGFKEVVLALANVYNVKYFIKGRMTKTITSISCSTKTWLLPYQCTSFCNSRFTRNRLRLPIICSQQLMHKLRKGLFWTSIG